LWYGEPNGISNPVGYAKFFSRTRDASTISRFQKDQNCKGYTSNPTLPPSGMSLPIFVRDFADSLRVIGRDFVKGKKFWLPVLLMITPSLLLATKFRSNMPQLTVSAEIVRQHYALNGQPLQNRDEFVRNLGV